MQQDSKLCQLCNTHIMVKCFQIHQRACNNKIAKAKSVVRKSPNSKNMMELIPCAQCGEMVDFSVYSDHLEECVGRQLMKCPKCKLLYPIFLFDQHTNVCTQFRQEVQEKLIYNNELELQEEEDHDLNNMIMTMAKSHIHHNNSDPIPLGTINKIPKCLINQSIQCSICYCEITKNSSTFKLRCFHKYHVRCLTAWLQKNPQCPMCRKHVLD